ncbi:MAG: DNA polymerase III subunit epsilon [Gammaproteobacteria bacterium]|nr:DNA polymerase III subunit epsilon [Gammaproteobacteria bacterium]
MRQVVLDTETTGLDPDQGHRIIEIGCVEIVSRRTTDNGFHQYLNPNRAIDEGAFEVHGITNEFLSDKPEFPDIVNDLLEYLKGAQLIIHNAPFDVGFLDAELNRCGHRGRIEDFCEILDTLSLARQQHPGQRNDLDALCRRYEIDNTQRTLHGARLDAEILADVYLAMTGGQTALSLDDLDLASASAFAYTQGDKGRRVRSLLVIQPTSEELALHDEWVARLDKELGGRCLWHRLD